MSIRTVLTSAMMIAGLSACSVFEPDYYNCDEKITSYAEGARSTLTALQTQQSVEVRFNGVSGQCYDDGNDTIMEVAIGLKVLRDLNDSYKVAPVNVPVAAAIIGNDGTDIRHETFSYDMQFTAGSRVLYPLVRREFKLGPDERLVLALTPEQLFTQ